MHEQRAIATALSDVDALLGGLDRLIAKKRDLKQAAMQQLLTGQTRLPGFHGEWEVKRLGEICGQSSAGGTAKTTQAGVLERASSRCTLDGHSSTARQVRDPTERITRRFGLASQRGNAVAASASLLVAALTIGKSMIASGEICIESAIRRSLVRAQGVDIEFLYYAS